VVDVQAQFAEVLRDRYVLERELGRGGMATVYLAQDLKHNRQVAFKVLRPELASPVGVERFLREIQTASHLSHPHVLPVFDSGEAQGLLWYTMPYVQGESLRARLRRDVQLSVDEAVHLTREIAEALAHAHRHGVIHRDIKPENILLSEGHALVADFGIAKAISEAASGSLTDTGLALGTPAYMSPEQAMGRPPLDGRTDIYSLGCVAYEMLVGEPPFTGPTTQAVLARALVNPVPSICTVRPEVPRTLERAIVKCLAKVAADRWPSAADFGGALRRVGVDSEPAATVKLPLSPGGSARRRLVTFGSGLLLLVALGTGGVAVLRRNTAHPSAAASAPAGIDPLAYEAYRRGADLLRHRTQRSVTKAIELFTEATRRDSNYANGWAGLGRAMGWARDFQYRVPGVPPESLTARQLEASERAIELDSLSPESWLVRLMSLSTWTQLPGHSPSRPSVVRSPSTLVMRRAGGDWAWLSTSLES
jgi:hypothetical protein